MPETMTWLRGEIVDAGRVAGAAAHVGHIGLVVQGATGRVPTWRCLGCSDTVWSDGTASETPAGIVVSVPTGAERAEVRAQQQAASIEVVLRRAVAEGRAVADEARETIAETALRLARSGLDHYQVRDLLS